MSEVALTDVERLAALADAERTFQMNEEAFRQFYEWTARPVWLYLARMTGDDRLADDLLQEAYYRFLRANASFESDDHRRNYLFRIATNLVRDLRRRPRPADRTLETGEHLIDPTHPARPMTWLYTVAAVLMGVGVLLALTTNLERAQDVYDSVAVWLAVRAPVMPPVTMSLMELATWAVRRELPLLLGVAFCLLAAPIALYLALHDE